MTENAMGIRLLSQSKNTYPTISKAWADSGFKDAAVERGATIGIDVEVVPRKADTPGFHVLKRRWVAERTFGWLMLHRRLASDYETLDSSSEAMIHIASIDNLTRRITGETTQTWRSTY
jgi:transposase